MPCSFASASHMAAPQLEAWIPSPINLEAKTLTLAHWKPIHLPIDRLLFMQLSRIPKPPLTPRSKKSPPIFQQVSLQMKFLDHLSRTLAAPFGRDMRIWRIAHHKISPLLPQNDCTLNYQHPYWPAITPTQAFILPLYILHLAKQAQDTRKKMRFLHLWLILR